MKINDRLHGFKLTRVVSIPDVSGVMHEMIHEKSGAYLCYLERSDENKTFAIGFRTLPINDTGVFHIIEHSVLCGSDKYPVKEPFVELLKGSQNTFLNALTYEDRTVYPVSSRNPKDFLNLMNVYMDAVLHPTALKNPQIFRQEGWHYEFDAEGKLIYNGVVFNEMKGAYSSADEISMAAAKASLFPDTPYKYESGGAPSAIPNLTFEEFCASHAKFYHPSNAMMFLDGEVDLDAALSLLDSYLCEYDEIEKSEAIREQAPVDGGTVTVHYEISENEDPSDKARLSLNYVYGTPSDAKLMLATTAINDALLGSNDSPLKKAVLDSGLCQDIDVFTNKTIQQSIQLEARGVKEENLGALETLINDTIRRIASEGIDRDSLSATINRLEFKSRECDFGGFPKGVAFALSVFGEKNYGRPAEAGLAFEADMQATRAELSGDYFEKTLLAMTVDNPHRSKVIMLPDKDYGKKVAEEERARLAREMSEMSDEDIARIKRECDELKAWQASVDSPEALATLPQLTKDEIYISGKKTPTEVSDIGGTRLISHDIDTSKISYLKFFFDASDLELEELFVLSVASSLLKNVKTEKHTPTEIQNMIKSELGSLAFSIAPAGRLGEERTYFTVIASALDSKKKELSQITREVLLTSDLSDKNALRMLLMQEKMMNEEMFSAAGHSVAISRVMASLYADGVVREYISGYERYRLIKGLIDNFDSQIDMFIDKMNSVFKKVITRDRLMISHTGAKDRDLAEEFSAALPADGIKPERRTFLPLGYKREAVIIPSRVSYAVSAADIGSIDNATLGEFTVARSLLSYEYLWNQIRVLGGAYGTGFIVRQSGIIGCYSYRDPSPFASLEKYSKCGEFIREFCKEGADLTKFIIGAVGEYDTMLTPRLEGYQATAEHLAGVTHEDKERTMKAMLAADGEALLKVADIIDKAYKAPTVCVVGTREQIEGDKTGFDHIIEI